MSVNWGGFGAGLSAGLTQGYILGEKFAKAMRAYNYEKEQNAINEDYDNRVAQSDAKHAQIKALNEGGDVQRATDEAYKGAIPVAQAGIREIAARDPENGGRWTPTLNDASTYQQTDKAAAMTRHPELQDTAIPRFSRTTAEQDRERLNGERKQALMRSDRKYYANDPAMSRQLRKEQEDEDLKQGLLQVYQGALNGDPKYLGVLAGAAQQYGLLPSGTHIVPNNDGTFALIDESGHVYTDENGNAYTSVSPNREMIENVFAKFAMQQKMYHDGDFKGMVAERRAAHKEDREDRKVDVQENYLTSRAATLQAQALAKASGYGSGKWKPNADGTGITLFGTDAMGNKDFPLLNANLDGTNKHPASIPDADWNAMVKQVQDEGFQLGINDKLQPIVVTADGSQSALYSDWSNKQAQWEPSQSISQPTALPSGMAGASKQKQAVQFFDRRQRDTSSPGPMPQSGSRVSEQSGEGPVARAYPVPDSVSTEVPFSGEKGEPAEKAKAKEKPKAVPTHGSNDSYIPGKGWVKGAPSAEHERNDAVANNDWTPWRGWKNNPDGTPAEPGGVAGALNKFEAINQERMKDNEMAPEWGKRAIAASKGEPRKSAMEDLHKQATAEQEKRKQAVRTRLPQNKLPETPKTALPAKTKVAPAKVAPAQSEQKLPVKGKVVMKPGDDLTPDVKKQKGQDFPRSKGYRIKAKQGSQVEAVAKGKVDFNGYMQGYGKVVIVTDKNGKQHVYTNVESSAKKGDSIQAGTKIGVVGKQFDYMEYSVRTKGKA